MKWRRLPAAGSVSAVASRGDRHWATWMATSVRSHASS
jgi:hypothetical protein